MKRLEAIIKFINQDDIVADIGCDHGYLLKLAIENKNIKKGYAIDNKKGPLDTAIKNLENFNNIVFKLSDGLLSVNEDDINCVVIAGMGGMLINKIVSDSLKKIKTINKIILCPNRNNDKVRKYMTENGFMIVDESIVYEDRKYYEVLVFQIGTQTLTERELYFGPYLLKNKSLIFINKWTEYYNKIKHLSNKKNEINLINEVLHEN